MQVTETLSEGLKRAYKVVMPAGDLATRLDGQLTEMKAKARINGFRPGKVPMAHLKKLYGKSVMADVVQNAITSANKQIVDDHKLRLAREPRVDLPTDQGAIEAALMAEGTEWAKETLHGLHHGSPSAVMWSFEAMRRGAKLSLRGALAAELALTRAVSVHPEFHEGVRAMLVDKDRTPKWQPAHLADVDPAAIQALFA